MRAPAALLAAIALLGAPAGVLAQGASPFQPLPQAPPDDTPTVVVAPSNGSGDGLKTWQELLIFGAGVVLIGGIGWAIVSDARNRAPVSDGELGHPGAGAVKRNRSRKQRERARAKAKTGRAQRKRNRRRR